MTRIDTIGTASRRVWSNRSVRFRLVAAAAAIAAGALLGGAAALGPGPKVEFADAQIFFEYNSTADDMGIQLFLDAEAWRQVQVWDPLKRRALKFTATAGGFREIGLT